MRITLQDKQTSAVKTLASGEAAAQAVASMQVSVSQSVDTSSPSYPADAVSDVLSCGGGKVSISWSVTRDHGSFLAGAKSTSMTVTLDNGTIVPCLRGMLTISAPDGAGVIVKDAAVTSSSAAPISGGTWRTVYSVIAAPSVTLLAGSGSSSSGGGAVTLPGIGFGDLTLDVTALADDDATILVDADGLALVEEVA